MDKGEESNGPLSRPPCKPHLVDPTPLLVTHQAKLDKLVGLYTYCLTNNLVPNILAELYLLLELLTVKNNSLEDFPGMDNNADFMFFLFIQFSCLFKWCDPFWCQCYLQKTSMLLIDY